MHVLPALVLGTVIGVLEGITIFFVPQEPHKVGVFFGASIKGALTGLLIGYAIPEPSLWWQGVGYGFLFGAVLGLMVTLPQGGFTDGEAKYTIPYSALGGGLVGLVIAIIQ